MGSHPLGVTAKYPIPNAGHPRILGLPEKRRYSIYIFGKSASNSSTRTHLHLDIMSPPPPPPLYNATRLNPEGVEAYPPSSQLEDHLYKHAHIDYTQVHIEHNPSIAQLYEDALTRERGSAISSTGALVANSGRKTGRSPKDKRIVEESSSADNIWWGPVNIKLNEHSWEVNRERAIDYLNTREILYVIDAFAGWDPRYRIKVRIVCARAYHALFMWNMLIRPTEEELKNFGQPDFTVYNAGRFPANRHTDGMTSDTSVDINFKAMEMVILGTEYAGEMKKGIFSVMFYLMPIKHQVLVLHSSANQGKKGDTTLFFGLSGTGKTTLSADINRDLIGDDEHCWSNHGVFNIEGGCYAKCINLKEENEPEIFRAVRFGAVLENVVFDPKSHVVDYDDTSLTENTRCSYPIENIPNAKLPALTDHHPTNIVLLTCDASGVLPPVSRLTPEQVMFHFISGYTSKVAGTEEGITEPTATFSACFGQPFLVLHPMHYAKQLAEKMHQHKANAWLLNTGWSGNSASKGGKRISLKYTRAMLDAIHSGELSAGSFEEFGVFGLSVPKAVSGVPSEVLNPERSWKWGPEDFQVELTKLATKFNENFERFADKATPDVLAAAPKVPK